MTRGSATAESPVLEVRALSKTFPGQRALVDVDYQLMPGEIHALVGPNGCGKSTLIKVISGFYHPDRGGAIVIDGNDVTHGFNTAAAYAAGLRVIHQDLALVPNLTVLENLGLSRGFRCGPAGIRWGVERSRARAALEPFGLEALVDVPVGALSTAHQAVVAIARALEGLDDGADREARVLVLDEATTALSRHEVGVLFDALRRARDHGVGVLYVSHRLDEIFELADRVSIMRDARMLSTSPVADLDRNRLVELISGGLVRTEAASHVPYVAAADSHDAVIAFRSVSTRTLHRVTIELRVGEVVGLTGLLGCGASELANLLYAGEPVTTGTIEVRGESVAVLTPRRARARGIAYVPADRRTEGSIPGMTIRENVTLPALGEFMKGGRLRIGAERAAVRVALREGDVRPAEPERVFATLSGGNQQKAILERWLRLQPPIIVLLDPTNGIDVTARSQILKRIREAARRGACVLVASPEWDHLPMLCDRVVVMTDGRVSAELRGETLSRENIAASAYRSGVSGVAS